MSEYPKEIEGIVVNNAQEEEIAKEELARAKIKLQIKKQKTFAKVQVAGEIMKESINQLNDKDLTNFNARFKLEQEQKATEELEKRKKDFIWKFMKKYYSPNISYLKAQSIYIAFLVLILSLFYFWLVNL